MKTISRVTYGRERGSRPRPGLAFRGSRARLRRVRVRGNWSVEMWMFVMALLFAVLVAIPWLVRH